MKCKQSNVPTKDSKTSLKIYNVSYLIIFYVGTENLEYIETFIRENVRKAKCAYNCCNYVELLMRCVFYYLSYKHG